MSGDFLCPYWAVSDCGIILSMDASQIKKFREIITSSYHKNGRHNLPWRETRDPYKILISEVMLQQTQVSRVLKKYPEFIKAFPTPNVLAKAPLKRILSVWQGMGYNRRAIALKGIADAVMRECGRAIPDDPALLEKFPGIGKNTAGAIVAFAFNKPAVFIETNIRRVFIHHFFPRLQNISDKKLLPLIEETLDKKNPREWYWALMDYGAALPKHVKNPNRRSRHYAKQRPFKGSNREVRGLILKAFINRGSLSHHDLRKHIRHKELEKNLRDLAREGFLKKEQKQYSLA